MFRRWALAASWLLLVCLQQYVWFAHVATPAFENIGECLAMGGVSGRASGGAQCQWPFFIALVRFVALDTGGSASMQGACSARVVAVLGSAGWCCLVVLVSKCSTDAIVFSCSCCGGSEC